MAIKLGNTKIKRVRFKTSDSGTEKEISYVKLNNVVKYSHPIVLHNRGGDYALTSMTSVAGSMSEPNPVENSGARIDLVRTASTSTTGLAYCGDTVTVKTEVDSDPKYTYNYYYISVYGTDEAYKDLFTYYSNTETSYTIDTTNITNGCLSHIYVSSMWAKSKRKFDVDIVNYLLESDWELRLYYTTNTSSTPPYSDYIVGGTSGGSTISETLLFNTSTNAISCYPMVIKHNICKYTCTADGSTGTAEGKEDRMQDRITSTGYKIKAVLDTGYDEDYFRLLVAIPIPKVAGDYTISLNSWTRDQGIYYRQLSAAVSGSGANITSYNYNWIGYHCDRTDKDLYIWLTIPTEYWTYVQTVA